MTMMTMILAATMCLQDTPAETIDQLIRDLAADTYKTREAADQELRKIGAPAVPALKKAAEDPDPERAQRAERILKAIEEPTPPEPSADLPRAQVRIETRVVTNGVSGATSLEMSGDGHVKATVRENDETRTYEADSMDEFREKYPDVAKKFRLGLALPRMDVQVIPPPAEDPLPGAFGIQSGAVGEALADQLDLKPGEGVLIKAVTPDSRAAKAGLRQYDIILSVDGRKDGDLAAIVDGCTIEILRGGQRQTIIVKAEPK